MRVDGPMSFEVAAEPLQELRSPSIFGDFNSVVDTDETCTALGLFLDSVEVRQGGVSAATVGVDDDSVCGIESRVISWPTVA